MSRSSVALNDAAPIWSPRLATKAKEQKSSRPALRVVRGVAPARSAVPFVLLLVFILVGALVASTLLNAAMASTAFKMQQKQVELNVVNDHVDTVRAELEDAESADNLAQRASALGMVPAGSPGVIDLSTESLSAGQTSGAK